MFWPPMHAAVERFAHAEERKMAGTNWADNTLRGRMKSLLVLKAFALSVVSVLPTNVAGEKPVIVPLNEIWAYDMPGTRKVGDLDAVKSAEGGTKHPIVNEIVRSLGLKRPTETKSVGPAFIVQGTEKEALRNAHAVLTNVAKPSTKFSSANDLTLVFYTSLGGPYAHIDSVERTGRTITAKYRLVSHNTREDTLHFALIPLGPLGSGTYEVKIDLLGLFDQTGARKEPKAKSKNIVCSDTTFDVTERRP